MSFLDKITEAVQSGFNDILIPARGLENVEHISKILDLNDLTKKIIEQLLKVREISDHIQKN